MLYCIYSSWLSHREMHSCFLCFTVGRINAWRGELICLFTQRVRAGGLGLEPVLSLTRYSKVVFPCVFIFLLQVTGFTFFKDTFQNIYIRTHLSSYVSITEIITIWSLRTHWIYKPEKKKSSGAIMMLSFPNKLLIKRDQVFKTINLKQTHSILFLLARTW